MIILVHNVILCWIFKCVAGAVAAARFDQILTHFALFQAININLIMLLYHLFFFASIGRKCSFT